MNYLKKKINKHKAANRNHDDDDVYDYIPAVPPHPSELQETESDRLNGQISEEELRKREEKRRQLEEKKRQLEETKKGQEAWKFFEQLNQRVSDTVTKSQIVIETLKDSTTADELIREAENELGFPAQDSDDEEPQKGATFSRGSWIGFDDQQFEKKSESPAPAVAASLSPKTSAAATPITPIVPFVVDTILAPEPVALPEKPSVVVDLFENFAFENENENQSAEPEASAEEDDPFDTSYVSVSPVDPKVAAEIISSEKIDSRDSQVNKTSRKDCSPVRPENLNLGMDSESDKRNSSVTPDAASLPPDDAIGDADFDNDVTDLYLQQNKRIHTSRYGSTTSLASILSNPFLNEDFQDDFNPPDNVSVAGSVTPGRRRGSTNPFEDSPGDESPPVSTGASAIAALTADFCSAIESADEIVVRPESSAPPDSESVDDMNPKKESVDDEPVSPQVIEPDSREPENDEVEPELVVEEPEVKEETNELSHEEDSYDTGTNELLQPEDKSGPPPPPPSAEPFDPFATIVDDHHDEENDGLQPPRLPDYPSDVSDVEDQEARQEVSSKRESVTEFRPNEAQQQTGESVPRRRSSAFDIRPDHSSKRSSVSSSSSRRASVIPRSKPFDPFQQVDEDSATPPREEDESVAATDYMEEQAPSIEPSPNYAMDQTFDEFPPPEDIASYIAENADQTSEKEELKIIPETEEPLPPPPESLLQNHVEFTDPSVDPFDTSNFSFEPVADAVPVTDKSSFDAFTSRFQNTSEHGTSGEAVDAFASPLPARKVTEGSGFDTFNPNAGKRGKKQKESKEDDSSSSSDDDGAEHFKIVIKAKMRDPVQLAANASIPVPLLPPPPKTPVKGPRERGEFDEFESFFTRKASVAKPAAKEDDSPPESSVRSTDRRDYQPPVLGEVPAKRGDSTESPSTPLYDTDISQPLEEFPAKYQGDGWEMFIRYPPKKKLTGQRFWKKIYVRVSENSIIQLFNTCNDTDPFQELPLQPSYSLSEISAQQYDQFGKIFTVKLQYIFYRERVGVRKGQIAKVIQGQVTSFGSIAKLGMPLDHAPQVSELIKLGTQNYDDARSIQQVVEEALFRMPLHRDRALTYKTEEIQITVADEYYVEQNRMGTILKQLARVRIFLIAFLNGMPGVEIGVNDLTRQGKEVVGRYDIIPVVTEEWIRLEDYEFHSCVMTEEFEKTRTIKLIPPDACYFELMRFRVRPPRNRELPLQVTANLYVTKTKVELRCEVLVPGAVSKKYGQIPCEDIVIRIHIPECWIYFFRTEKHMRFGSVKSAARRPGKIKVTFHL